MNIDEFKKSYNQALSVTNCFSITVKIRGYGNEDIRAEIGKHFGTAVALHQYVKEIVDIDPRVERMLKPYNIEVFKGCTRNRKFEQALCESFDWNEIKLRKFLIDIDELPNTDDDRRFYNAIGNEYRPD